MFKNKIAELNARALVRKELPDGDFTFETKTLAGIFYRVFPYNGREVCYLESLSKGTTMFAPESGDGILVRADVINYVSEN
jgi:hypothetical protein